MKKIAFVTPSDARHGFTLAGVVQVVTAMADVPKTVDTLTADAAIGVLVIDERLINPAARAHLDEMERHWPGIVVVLPAPAAAATAEDYAMRLIRQAVGYQVRVNP